MIQEQKELLLKDLCGRLPYGVKAYVRHWSKLSQKYYEDIYDVKSVFPSLNEVHVQSKTGSVNVLLGYSDYEIKPYLFPLSSMTDEQEKDIFHNGKFYIDHHNSICRFPTNEDDYDFVTMEDCLEIFNKLNKYHFDYRGLISMGLAIDATGLDIY